MKKLRKVISLLLAGVTAVTALLCGSVTASAASSKTALLTTTLSTIDSKAEDITTLGQGIYMLTNSETGYRTFYRIDSEEIKAWRSSGKLTPTKLTADDKLSKCTGYYTDSSFIYGNYAVFYRDVNDVRTYYVVKYNKSKKTLTTIYSSKNYTGVSSDGYISEFIWDSDTRKLKLKILNNKAKLVKQLNYEFPADGCSAKWRPFLFGSDTMWLAYSIESELDESLKGGHVIAIDKKGNTKEVSDSSITQLFVGNNYFTIDQRPLAEYSYVYLTSKGKGYSTYNLRYYTDSSNNTYTIDDFGDKIYGTKAIATYRGGTEEEPVYKYALVNVSSGKRLSAVYDGMYTKNEGNTYLVNTPNNKVSFLNSKGKKIATFDDADDFWEKGKYTPVIKGGKLYLVDKNMKQVSKTITVDKDSYVYSFGEELFVYIYKDEVYLMTNKK